MGVETNSGTASFVISKLNRLWPLNSETIDYGDDHIRTIKAAILNTFPNVTGKVNASHTEMNLLVGLGSLLSSLSVAVQSVSAQVKAITAINGILKGGGSGTMSAATAGTDFVSPTVATTFTAPQRSGVVTLTFSTTYTLDLSASNNFEITLTNNLTIPNPANPTIGQSGVIRFVQDGTGSRTLTMGSQWAFEGGIDPVLTTTASATDLIAYYVETTSKVFAKIFQDTKN